MKVCRIEGSVPSFKSANNHDILGFDDSVSAARRNFIREHYIDRSIPYYSVWENSRRLNEYQLTNLLRTFLGNDVNIHSLNRLSNAAKDDFKANEDGGKIGYDMMMSLPLSNVQLIYGSNSYRGSTPAGNISALPLMKDAGIKKIVDLHGYRNLGKACEEYGLDYLCFIVPEKLDELDAFNTKESCLGPIKSFYNRPGMDPVEMQNAINRASMSWDKRLEEYINKFVEFIQVMQSGNVYIGCECGTCRTNNALMLNHFFNPDASKTSDCLTKFNFAFLRNLEIFYNNLKPEYKVLMRWSEEFDKSFLPKLKSIRSAGLKFK